MKRWLGIAGVALLAVGRVSAQQTTAPDGPVIETSPYAAPAAEPVCLPEVTSAESYGAYGVKTYAGLVQENAYSSALMGYGVYSFTNARGVAAYPPDLLPTPTDPGDYQVNDLLQTSSVRTSTFLGPGGLREGEDGRATGILFQHNVQGKLGLFYDTGFAGGTALFTPNQIALDGTPEARQRGQLGFADADLSGVPLNVELGAQMPDTGAGHLQLYTELLTDNVDNDVDDGFTARRAYVRWLNTSQNSTMVVGKSDTMFGDLGCSPNMMTVGSIPIGACGIPTDGISVISSSHLWYNIAHEGDHLEFGVSAEDQSGLEDVVLAASAVSLNRYPTLVSRVRYAAAQSRFDSYQIAALVRPIGVEDVNFVEHFEAGWGVSAVGRFLLPWGTLDALYAGVATGEGMGGYIFNGTPAATMTTPTTLTTLQNFSTFGGYQHYWWVEDKYHNFASNAIVGYVRGDAASAADSRILTQGAVNFVWNLSEVVGFGVEYQYGRREVGSGANADDHRIMFGLEVSTGSANKEAGTASAGEGGARMQYTGVDGNAAPSGASPSSSGVSNLRL